MRIKGLLPLRYRQRWLRLIWHAHALPRQVRLWHGRAAPGAPGEGDGPFGEAFNGALDRGAGCRAVESKGRPASTERLSPSWRRAAGNVDAATGSFSRCGHVYPATAPVPLAGQAR